jgi:N-acyl-D-aspartate/D-glutamate deacylase
VETDLAGRFRICFPPYGQLPSLDELQRFDDVGLGLHDAGAHLSQIASAAWPGRLLGTFVRDGGLPLERAVQHATSLSAQQFGILDRGLLISGRPADIVIFDPETVGDGPVHEVDDLPEGAKRLISEPVGIEHVIVNGTVIREHNKDSVDPEGVLPGRLLRDFQPAARTAPRRIPEWIRRAAEGEWDARVTRLMEMSGGHPPADPAQPGRILV